MATFFKYFWKVLISVVVSMISGAAKRKLYHHVGVH